MRPFSGPAAAGVKSNVSCKQSPTTSSRSTRTTTTRSMAWSLFCTLIVLNTFLAFLSPSTSGGRALAGPEAGFCADCKTFSNAISVCGGTFGPADIEKPGEYVLQQEYAKCTCTAVMQKVLWTCGKCEFLAGKGSSGVPPKKHQMTCMGWGITVEAYAAPYTGVVEPGTTTDLGGGTPNPPPPPPTTSSNSANPNPPPTGNPKPSGDGGNKPSGTTTDSSLPSSSHDNLDGGNKTETGSSGPNTAAIGISVGIIGVALIAGVMAVVMMKRRRRRRSPLDLDSSPALANFAVLEDKWDTKPSRQTPTSPPLPPVPVASAAPVIGGRGNGRGYGEGSVVGGYDAQYDGHYDGYGHHGGYDAQYDGYGYGGQQQYGHYDQGGQYDQGRYDQGYDQGYHPGQPDAYQMHDYGYDQHVVAASQQQGPPPPKGDAKRPM
ncbi:hypothetical protein EC991_006115 [Linnemannia zychae]|nr:hypothetical protein EC991_006115 [Linnemannia zychae]